MKKQLNVTACLLQEIIHNKLNFNDLQCITAGIKEPIEISSHQNFSFPGTISIGISVSF